MCGCKPQGSSNLGRSNSFGDREYPRHVDFSFAAKSAEGGRLVSQGFHPYICDLSVERVAKKSLLLEEFKLVLSILSTHMLLGPIGEMKQLREPLDRI